MDLKLVRWIDIYIGIPLAYLLFFINRLSFNRRSPPHQLRSSIGQNFNWCGGKILLIKFWGIGNLVMLLPAAKGLRAAYPKAGIDLLTLLTNKEVGQNTALFDNLYTIDNSALLKFIISALKAFRVLSAQDYDLVIDFEQFARFSALFSNLIAKSETIGFHTTGQHRHLLFTQPVRYNNHIHMTESFYSLAAKAGAALPDKIQPVSVADVQASVKKGEEILRGWGIRKDKGRVIIFHIGTSENFSLRRWPSEHFAQLADRLIDSFGVKIIFTGLADEAALVKRCINYIKHRENISDVSGKLTVSGFIALMVASNLLVSADTAPVHIASSLSIPVVGLYGPNTPLLYGPWSGKSISFYKKLTCSPCITNYNAKLNKCRHPDGQGACMRQISVDEVFLGIKENYETLIKAI